MKAVLAGAATATARTSIPVTPRPHTRDAVWWGPQVCLERLYQYTCKMATAMEAAADFSCTRRVNKIGFKIEKKNYKTGHGIKHTFFHRISSHTQIVQTILQWSIVNTGSWINSPSSTVADPGKVFLLSTKINITIIAKGFLHLQSKPVPALYI